MTEEQVKEFVALMEPKTDAERASIQAAKDLYGSMAKIYGFGGPKRIQRKRTAGWRMPPNTVYVGRPTKWGNPFKPSDDRTVGQCIDSFLDYLVNLALADVLRIEELRGKDLACWCRLDQPCHADILLEWANGQVSVTTTPMHTEEILLVEKRS